MLKELLFIKEYIYAYGLMPKFVHTYNADKDSIIEIKSMILTTSDASFIYKCANCFDKIYTPSFVNRLIELKNYEVLVNILINIEFDEEILNPRNVESYVITNLNLILNIMIDCPDESIFEKIASSAKSPYIREYFTKLSLKLKNKKQLIC